MQVYQPTSSGVTCWISKDKLAVTRIRRSNLASTSPRCQVRLKRTVLATRHVKMTFAPGDAVALEGTVIAGGGSAEIHRHKWVKKVRLYIPVYPRATEFNSLIWICSPSLIVFFCLWVLLRSLDVCELYRSMKSVQCKGKRGGCWQMCGLGHKWGIYTEDIHFIREVFPVTPANHVTGPATAQSGKQLRKWVRDKPLVNNKPIWEM